MKLFLITLVFSLNVFALTGTDYNPAKSNDMDKSKVNFNGMKVAATVPAASTLNIDMPLVDDHLLTGASLVLTGNCDDDEIKFQVVMGTTVVNQFIDWYAMNLSKDIEYPAKIPGGLILRAVYKNTCPTNSVKVRVNYNLHKVLL